MTIREALSVATQVIAARDGELLLGLVVARERPWIVAHPESTLEAHQETAFGDLVRRRSRGEPLQYISGVQEFFGLPLRVGPGVLIPRPETEHLVEAVIAWAATQQGELRIIDVGTGSGAIALALADQLPQARVSATDISSEALVIARENARRLGLSERVTFVEGDLLCGVAERQVDVVVSNPPYIPQADAADMQRQVVEHEPHSALFAGVDGFDIYRRLIPAASAALRDGGLLAMELGFGQQAQMKRELASWRGVRFIDDLAGIPRVVLAYRS